MQKLAFEIDTLVIYERIGLDLELQMKNIVDLIVFFLVLQDKLFARKKHGIFI